MKISWELYYMLNISEKTKKKEKQKMTIKTSELEPGVQGIYKINFPNGKIYIGLSIDIKRRIWEHNCPHEDKTPCDKAINKYGRI